VAAFSFGVSVFLTADLNKSHPEPPPSAALPLPLATALTVRASPTLRSGRTETPCMDRQDRWAVSAKATERRRGLGPVFGNGGLVYYRASANGEYFVSEHDPASGTVRTVTSEPVVNAPSVTPDGQWLVSTIPVSGDDAAVVRLYPVRWGSPVEFCPRCFNEWTSDGREMFLSLSPIMAWGSRNPFSGRLQGTAGMARDRRSRPVFLVPVPQLTSYTYVKTNAQQNLYKLQLPR
jgi:hypothetical protein